MATPTNFFHSVSRNTYQWHSLGIRTHSSIFRERCVAAAAAAAAVITRFVISRWAGERASERTSESIAATFTKSRRCVYGAVCGIRTRTVNFDVRQKRALRTYMTYR